jgi:hypothetical protein
MGAWTTKEEETWQNVAHVLAHLLLVDDDHYDVEHVNHQEHDGLPQVDLLVAQHE